MEQEVDHIKKTEDLIKKLQGELAQMKLNSASNVKPEVIENKQQEDFQRNMFLWNQKQILMELPHFDGNPKDWSKFKNAFDVTTTQAEYSNLDNLSRLEKALKGTAAKSVQPLMISANNVPHIMRKLEEQFGQASMICRELRGDLERIKKLGNKTINEIADKLDCFIINMNTLNRADLLTDPRLLEELIWKLPYNLQVNWVEYTQKYVTQHQRQPALTELNTWIKPHAATQLAMNNMQMCTSAPEKKGRMNVHHDKNREQPREHCRICNSAHKIEDCYFFTKLCPQERVTKVFKLKLCTKCLKPHNYKKCYSQKKCGIDNCPGRHHKLLHGGFVKTYKERQPSEETIKTVTGSTHAHHSRDQVFYQIIPITLKNGPISVHTSAFLDPGSSLTLIDNEVAKELNLKGSSEPLTLKWTNNVSREERDSKLVKFQISGTTDRFYSMAEVRTAEDLHLPIQSLDYDELAQKYSYLRDLPIKSYLKEQPKLLIGLNHSHLLVPYETRIGGPNNPIAIKTLLGWLIFGNISEVVKAKHLMVIQEDTELSDLIKRHISIEDFGVKIPLNLPQSKEVIRAKYLIDETLKRKGVRYEIGLLWKYDNPKFPKSFNNAYKRLENMERKLKNEEATREWAIQTMKDYINKGYARKLTPSEIKSWSNDAYYLPYFIVENKKKLRLVFDAAAKINGVSFNSMLLAGPDATTSSFGITIRFREGAIAVAADIKEMFSQVAIKKEDQRKQCFLWRNCDQTRNPEIYCMQVMIFGSTCSPACAQAVKNYNASLFKDSNPQASEAIIKQHYVDDYMDSFDSMDNAIKTVNDVISIHDHASFFIRDFVSNEQILLASLPSNRIKTGKIRVLNDKDSQTEKVLGLYWNTKMDYFSFELNFEKLPLEVRNSTRKPTKREVLSFIMSIYDPLGLISHLTIHGKIIMQEMHKESSNWDEDISDHLYKRWKHWLSLIESAKTIVINRCIMDKQSRRFELHVFVDASEYAFCATIYVRGIDKLNNTTSVRLLSAKSRVAPIRKLSIPRLELMAAILGTRLAETIHKELRKRPDRTIFWSDSQTVLSWINSDHRNYKQFVAHRIGELLDTTTMDQWRYVPTEMNPADEGTKMVKNSKWISGPKFLKDPESCWPSSRFSRNTTEELRDVTLMFHTSDEADLDFIEEIRYSRWVKLLNRMCVIKKFVDWVKDKKNFQKHISDDDREVAEQILIRKAQWDVFTEEMKDLTKNGRLTIRSKIACLTPALNERGVMIFCSRLSQTNIVPETTRQPFILPYKHHITRLIMQRYHEKFLHQTDEAVLAAVYQKYWVIKSRALLKNIKSNCQVCKIRKAIPAHPQMAALPDCRLSLMNPTFTHTGVDYFGPIEVRVHRSVEKRWGVIFTCMTTRASHIELAENMTTDAFIMCLRNFQNRRGKISHLYSDNGTNFVGANKQMQILIKEINDIMGERQAAAMEIKWRFNPPVAPHFGGSWERLIRIIKNCLNNMLHARKDRLPSVEVLRSSLIQAEYILNSRPLTHIPLDNPNDEPLTPFHFLILRAGEYVPPLSLSSNSLSKQDYRLVQHYSQYFWDKWRKEYLPTIIKRNKWTDKVEPIKVDDIVVITDKSLPQGEWLKGRVVKVHTAQDGQVRSVDIETSKGSYTRASSNVAILDVKGDSSSTEKTPKQPKTTSQLARLHHHRDEKSSLNSCKTRVGSCFDSKQLIINPEKEITEMDENLSIITKADINFSNWGKRQKIDIDKVKQIRDKLNAQNSYKPRRKTRIRTPMWTFTMLAFFYLICAILGLETSGLIGYDCASPEVNMTSYSLTDVSSCLPAIKNLSITEVPIQVLQRSTKSSVMVYQCKVILKRSIRYCGMHSHISDYEHSYSYIVKEFTSEECKTTHLLGALALTHDKRIGELKRNSTTRGETLIIGSIRSSSCSGGTYRTPEYTWTNALVYYEYEISLYNYEAMIDTENDQIILRHGVVCPYSHGKCLDSEDGYSTWDISLNQRCEDTEFEVIFEGSVNKTINIDTQRKDNPAVYTSISDSHLFSIRTKGTSKICGYQGYKTDHPRIFILESVGFSTPFHKKPTNARNHDIFTYFNSKITLVENYIGQKLDDVYNSVMVEMCKIDKALMETKLTLARLNPTEFVNTIMKRSGFTAVVAGEVLHVLECKPVYVKPIESEICYQEIPVKFGNQTMFLAPVTRTLQLRGTEIDCTPLLPAKFQIGGRWYTTDGRMRETVAPHKLTSDIITKWTYTPLPNLMESGVYDSESLQKMKTMIYDQGDRRIASNVVHRLLAGQTPNRQGFYFDALVSEKIIDNVVNKYWSKLISWSTWIGNVTSTAIGLYMIGRFFKFIIDTLMHGRILYEIYGFGWQLLASFWDSLTTFLTHRNTLRNINRTATTDYDNMTTDYDNKANPGPSSPSQAAVEDKPDVPGVRLPPGMYPHVVV